MIRLFLEPLLQVAILIPFMILLLQEKSAVNFRRLFSFCACYLLYQAALILPRIHPALDFIKSRWNWDGKIYAILWAVMAYFLFRRLFPENNFFTFRQKKEGFKSASLGAVSIVLLSAFVWFLLGNAKLNYETLAFQLTLPGIDEEMIFRGILFGLLLSALRQNIPFLGNPALLITSALFGFIHALTLSENYSIRFNTLYFIQTAFAGWVWGWVTLRSRSILISVLSHNLSNFFGTLVTMLK